MFPGDATDIPFTPAYMTSPSPNVNSYYPYGDTVIFTPTPQPVVQFAIPQIEARSDSEVASSYGVQYQDDNFSVNIQEGSHARFHQDYPYIATHGPEAVNLIGYRRTDPIIHLQLLSRSV
ncbi:hypothetical protein EDD85DRAFT_788641 [Armillaria nabsnona]|nr:hypothetical protein EDD85DRAFT_788641 [Armillaria nabsnona]